MSVATTLMIVAIVLASVRDDQVDGGVRCKSKFPDDCIRLRTS